MRTRSAHQGDSDNRAKLRTISRDAGAERAVRNDCQADAQTRWQAIEVRHLAALAAVAREGSFRRAADRLGYVQSAISGQIARLEQAAGTRLLERASGTPIVELTPAGQILLRHTDEILARFETAYADVNSLASRNAGAARVAGLELFSPHRTAQILSLFRERHPFARLTLEEPSSGAADVELIRGGELDLLISESPPIDESLTQVVLEEDEYVLLAASSSELAARVDPIPATEIAALGPIVPSECATSGDLHEQLDELGIEARSSVIPESVATAQALAAAGVAPAVVPSGLSNARDPSTVAIDLSHLLAARAIVLSLDAGRTHSTAVYGFIDALREVCDTDPVADAVSDRRVQGDSGAFGLAAPKAA